MWCRNCNIELKDKDKCPVCGSDTVEDIPTEVYWCSKCRVSVLQEVSQADKGICPNCGSRMKYMAADGKKYLYDILNIKKETSNSLSS